MPWADFVITIGCDGTLLVASKLIKNNVTPVMGFNSTNSRTQLTLPHQYSENVENAFEKLLAGSFRLLMRSRIRTVMYGKGLYSQSYLVNQMNRTQREKRIEYVLVDIKKTISYFYFPDTY